MDDSELEFMVELRSADEGILKVLKTREMTVVESTLVFRVDQEVTCEETFVFPSEQLLIKSRLDWMAPVKHVFKQQAKAEVLTLDFSNRDLSFKGQVNKKFDYSIPAGKLDNYKVYLAR